MIPIQFPAKCRFIHSPSQHKQTSPRLPPSKPGNCKEFFLSIFTWNSVGKQRGEEKRNELLHHSRITLPLAPIYKLNLVSLAELPLTFQVKSDSYSTRKLSTHRQSPSHRKSFHFSFYLSIFAEPINARAAARRGKLYHDCN